MPSRFSTAFIYVFVFALVLVGAKDSAFAQQCTINVFVQNVGNHRIWVRNEVRGIEGSAVRTPLGGWRALRLGGWQPAGIPDSTGGPYFGLNKGQHIGDGYDTALACNMRRRFRVEFVCDTGPSEGSRFVRYYPSVDGWTPQLGVDNVTFQIGKKCN